MVVTRTIILFQKKICDKLSIELIDNLGNKIQSSSWLLKANNES